MTKEQIEKLGVKYTEGMTDDEVFEALSKMKGELTAEKSKFESEAKNNKSLVDKYSSEIATLKKEKQDRMTDEEKKKAEYQQMIDEIASLKKDKSVSEKTAKYLKLGYGEEVAKKIALGEIEGTDVSELHAQFLKEHDEALRKELLKKSPTPNGGGDPNKTFTKEGFRNHEYSYEDLDKLQKTNPALFDEITK
jgi:DNA-nicking Smr family endonuclease